MSDSVLDEIMSQADALPALPQVVSVILETLSDDAANVDVLSRHIAGDPVVAARLLAAANAGSFGGRPIQSLRQAVVLLGVGRVREITLATAVIDRFTAKPPFDAHRMWLHSLGVSICARDLAAFAGLDEEVAGIAGLLHDIGQLLLFSVLPDIYGQVLQYRNEKDVDIIFAEHDIIGIDHAKVGAELVRRWRLPGDVADAIAGHHVASGVANPSGIADVVHVAEVLSHALDMGSIVGNRVPDLSDLACARLGIDWSRLADHFPRIEARFEGARLMLGL